MKINTIINGKNIIEEINPSKRLLDYLREDLRILGVKEGCGEGECGACAVLIDNVLVNSCLVAVGYINNKEVVTIDYFKNTESYKIIEESFIKEGAVQCGFCTPGFVIATYTLLKKNKSPSEEEIKEGISGNLCRCTGYNMIVNAVRRASKRGEGVW
jgi:carbon-monoxide dehydrogenase small subunit